MSYIRDRAFILRSEPFREYDVRLSLYGERHGKLMAVARGARRAGAKHLGHLEPLNRVEVMIAVGKAFDKLAVARLIEARPKMRERLDVIAICGALADTVDLLTKPGASDSGIYHLLAELQNTLLTFQSAPSPERGRLVLAASYDRLMRELGYAISFDRCVRCAQDLHEPVWLAPRAGGLACEDCTRSLKREHSDIEVLSPQILKVLRFVRSAALEDVLRLTAETSVVSAAAEALTTGLNQAPLTRHPHGPSTVSALLDFQSRILT